MAKYNIFTNVNILGLFHEINDTNYNSGIKNIKYNIIIVIINVRMFLLL